MSGPVLRSLAGYYLTGEAGHSQRGNAAPTRNSTNSNTSYFKKPS
jgi:hypothetical protein